MVHAKLRVEDVKNSLGMHVKVSKYKRNKEKLPKNTKAKFYPLFDV